MTEKEPELQHTCRGFPYYEFKDFYGAECSLQESSIVEPECVWLGCEKNRKPHHITGTELSPRMHLTRKQARWIGEKLLEFANKGTITNKDKN